MKTSSTSHFKELYSYNRNNQKCLRNTPYHSKYLYYDHTLTTLIALHNRSLIENLMLQKRNSFFYSLDVFFYTAQPFLRRILRETSSPLFSSDLLERFIFASLLNNLLRSQVFQETLILVSAYFSMKYALHIWSSFVLTESCSIKLLFSKIFLSLSLFVIPFTDYYHF